jgi:sugar/nucleoside kinase (ribokinase family)
MKTFDVIVVGELNVDLIMNNLHAFPAIGKEVLSGNMNLTLGSSSAIFANNLSCLGANVAFAGKLGEDFFGDMVLQCLGNSGVNTELITRSKKCRTGATVVLNVDNDRAMVTYPGAMEEMSFRDIPPESLSRARHLHLSSYFLQPALREDVGDLFREAKQRGLTTSFDPQYDPQEKWDLDLEKILPYVDVFFPNEYELQQLTGKPDLQQAMDRLAFFTGITAIKRGTEGSVLLYRGNKIAQPAFFNDRFVDAIGAGDSFNAGFIYRFIQQDPPEACQRFGNLIGAFSTTAAGGTGAFSPAFDIQKMASEQFDSSKYETKR